MVHNEIREIFQNQHDEIASTKEGKILISHCGTFSTELIRQLAESLVKIATSNGAKSVMNKRLFSILLEGLKNLKLYAEPDEKNSKIGFLIVSRNTERYVIHISNIVSIENYKRVEKYLHQINSFTEEELEKTYFEILKNELLGLDGKKGRGFINARLKSNNVINHTVNELSGDLLLLNCFLVVNN